MLILLTLRQHKSDRKKCRHCLHQCLHFKFKKMEYVSANARVDINCDMSPPSSMACVLPLTTTPHATCATTSMHILDRFVICTLFLNTCVDCHLAVLVECTPRRSPQVPSWALHPPPVVANPQTDHHFPLQQRPARTS